MGYGLNSANNKYWKPYCDLHRLVDALCMEVYQTFCVSARTGSFVGGVFLPYCLKVVATSCRHKGLSPENIVRVAEENYQRPFSCKED